MYIQNYSNCECLIPRLMCIYLHIPSYISKERLSLHIFLRASCASKWGNVQHAEKVWETELHVRAISKTLCFLCVRAENILLSQVNDYKMNWFCALAVHRQQTYNVLNCVRRAVCISYLYMVRYLYCIYLYIYSELKFYRTSAVEHAANMVRLALTFNYSKQQRRYSVWWVVWFGKAYIAERRSDDI